MVEEAVAAQCAVELLRAEVRSATLDAPTVIVSTNEAANAERAIAAGLAYSLGERQTAKKVRAAAREGCRYSEGEAKLRAFENAALKRANRAGAAAELAKLRAVGATLETAIANAERRFDRRLIALADVSALRSLRSQLSARQAELATVLAEPEAPLPAGMDLNALIAQTELAEARVVRLQAEAASGTSWDVRLAAGVRQSMTQRDTGIFGAVQARWSLGAAKARSATNDLERAALARSRTAPDGFRSSAKKLALQMSALRSIEEAQILQRQQARQILQGVLDSLKGVDTELARSTREKIEIDMALLEAEGAGSLARLQAINSVSGTLISEK